jgi:hypothetical protein
LAKTKGMAIGHAFFHSSLFRVQLGITRSAFSRSRFNLASIGLQSLPATPAESLKSINKIHPTAKPDNYRQTSAKLFSALFGSR